MGFLITKLVSFFSGLDDFFKLWRDMFAALPLAVQVLVYFAFGGFMLLCLLRMLVNNCRCDIPNFFRLSLILFISSFLSPPYSR